MHLLMQIVLIISILFLFYVIIWAFIEIERLNSVITERTERIHSLKEYIYELNEIIDRHIEHSKNFEQNVLS